MEDGVRIDNIYDQDVVIDPRPLIKKSRGSEKIITHLDLRGTGKIGKS